jgi:hypothetical protein
LELAVILNQKKVKQMFESKIIVIEEQFKSIVHQLRTIDLMPPQKRREYQVNYQTILTSQVDVLVEHLRSISQDLDYSTLKNLQIDRIQENINSEIDLQPIASIPEIESTSNDDSLSDTQKSWIEDYNKILALDVDNFHKEKEIRDLWSQLGLKIMSISNLETVKAYGYYPEFKESDSGSFYALPHEKYYLIFLLPSLNITNEIVKYTFNIEGNGEYIDRVDRPAKVQRQGDKICLLEKGIINARR